jgi:hypothetical protein
LVKKKKRKEKEKEKRSFEGGGPVVGQKIF